MDKKLIIQRYQVNFIIVPQTVPASSTVKIQVANLPRLMHNTPVNMPPTEWIIFKLAIFSVYHSIASYKATYTLAKSMLQYLLDP